MSSPPPLSASSHCPLSASLHIPVLLFCPTHHPSPSLSKYQYYNSRPKFSFLFNLPTTHHSFSSTYFLPQISFSTYFSTLNTLPLWQFLPFYTTSSLLYLFHTNLLQIQGFQFTTLSTPPHYGALPSISPLMA